MPTPKWKLVVELGEPSCARPVQQTKEVSDTTPVTSSQAQTIDLHQQANSTSMNNTAVVSSSSSTASVKATGSNTVKETNNSNSQGKDSRIQEVISILGEYMPSDPKSPLVSYLPGFMSLRLMLLRSQWSPQESEIIDTMLGSYSSYTASGRTREDIAVLLARDCMFLQAQNVEVPQQTNVNTNNPTPNPTLSSSHSSPFSTSQQPPSQQQHNMFHHTQQSQSPFGLHSPNIGPSSNTSSSSTMMNNKHHNHHTHMQQQQMHPPSPSDSNLFQQAGASPLLNGQSSCFDFNPPTLSHDSLSIVSN